MQPQDTVALEQARWAEFVQRLGAHLAAQWPAMRERLGERYTSFVEHAVQQALQRGLRRAAVVARYVNLCFVWGPSFHDKPGFEWAQGLLAAPHLQPGDEWALSHRLVRRSAIELARRPDARVDAAALAAADERLLEAFGALGWHGALQPDEAPPTPRAACDLEALELRLLEPALTQLYWLEGDAWRRAEMTPPAPLRVDASRPLPGLLGLLARLPGAAAPARLQLRTRTHAVCDGALHPRVDFCGSHGLWRWQGHETRAVSWPVATLAQPLAAAGAGVAVAEETAPDIHRLDVVTCGLRDEGDPLGPLSAQVWAWPAAQWWVEIRRARPGVQPVVAGQPGAPAATRCRVECDGAAQDASVLARGFEQGLDRAAAGALQALAAAWAQVPGLAQPALEAALGLLVGDAALTWGWHPGPRGLDGRAFMRVLGRIAMDACAAEIQLQGELTLGGAASRLTLSCRQAAPLALSLQRESDELPLLEALLPARASFRLPFTADLVPLGSESGAVLVRSGPCGGALVGEAGLRPRSGGGSGFEWFASLRLEAVTLPAELIDPLLGVQALTLALLPARRLLDWRHG